VGFGVLFVCVSFFLFLKKSCGLSASNPIQSIVSYFLFLSFLFSNGTMWAKRIGNENNRKGREGEGREKEEKEMGRKQRKGIEKEKKKYVVDLIEIGLVRFVVCLPSKWGRTTRSVAEEVEQAEVVEAMDE
jgi:hypothetical protein